MLVRSFRRKLRSRHEMFESGIKMTALAASMLLFSHGQAHAQANSSTVGVQVVGEFNSDDTTVGGTLYANLSAQVTNAPVVNDESQIDGPYWTWNTVVTGTVNNADGTTSPVTPNDYQVTVFQADDGSPDAGINVEFNAQGVYQVYVDASVQYNTPAGSVSGDSGSVDVPGQE